MCHRRWDCHWLNKSKKDGRVIRCVISDFREELLETPKFKTFNDKETPMFNSV